MEAGSADRLLTKMVGHDFLELADAIVRAGEGPYQANLRAVRNLVVTDHEEEGVAALDDMLEGMERWADAFGSFGKAASSVAKAVPALVRPS
jgi:hypothetical protein